MPWNTPSPVFDLILTGHFNEDRAYTNWRERGTPDWLLIATLSGAGRFGHRTGSFTTTAGEMVLCQPGTLHDYGTDPAADHWELLWAHFHPYPHWHSWLEWPREAPGLMRLMVMDQVARDRIRERFSEAHRMATGASRRRDAFAMNTLEQVFLLCDEQNPRSDQGSLDPRVRGAMEYLCQNLGAYITLESLGDKIGLSPSRLSHLFRDQVGMTPHQFLESQRLTRARQLLELTPRTVEAIAYDVGYENPFYFSARFKHRTGLSPREYRRKGRQE